MTVETPPAADGGLPGPLLERIANPLWCHSHNYGAWLATDETLADLREAATVIAAQAARLAEKDAEIADLNADKDDMLVNFNASDTKRYEALMIAEAQLATATERLASAEAVIAPFVAEHKRAKRVQNSGFAGPFDMGVTMIKDEHLSGLDAWLTPKDGEKQP